MSRIPTYLPRGGFPETGGFCGLSCLVFETACSLNDRFVFDPFLPFEKLSDCDWLGRLVNMVFRIGRADF
jgi:hypothetical protein